MKKLTNDTYGIGVLGIAGIVLIIGLVILILPMVIGWALAYLIHMATGEPEITSYWARWVMGIALLIIASVFKPDIYVRASDNIRGKNRDYWYNDSE